MRNPLGQGERGLPAQAGISIVGGIVAIAVLGTILVSVDTIVSTSNPDSTALVASAKLAAETGLNLEGKSLGDIPIKESEKDTIIFSGNELTEQINERCQILTDALVKANAAPGTRFPQVVPPTPISGDVTVEGSRCVSAFVKADRKIECHGMTTKILFGAKPEDRKVISTPSPNVEKGKCITTEIEGADGKALSGDALKTAVSKLTGGEKTNFNKLVGAGAFDQGTNQTFWSAYDEQAKVAQENLEAKTEVAQTARGKANAVCFEASVQGDIDFCGDLTKQAQTAEEEQAAAKKQAEEAEALKKKFADTKKLSTEKPPVKEITDKTGCAANIGGTGCPCPPGTYGSRIPDCWRVGSNTFGDRGGLGAGGGAGGPGVLGGLMQALGMGQQPPAGNQTPRPAGTCTSGAAICSGNTVYSRNSQCVDTVVKYCEYGCSGNQCAQNSRSCPTSPAQPDASGCSGGTWKPTYTGACVSGWQCTSSQGDGPAAQISCQPEIADVGMDIAITYSCAAGTSSGAGFSTGGTQSGATTTTITSVPANTNTATYTLTCTDAGRSSNTSCKVQIGKPTIVLAANPAEVDEDEASTLGWVTSGMKSCVISSPDLEDFTNQNAHIENVNGTVTTPELDEDTDFVLKCTTVGGGTREATIRIKVD